MMSKDALQSLFHLILTVRPQAPTTATAHSQPLLMLPRFTLMRGNFLHKMWMPSGAAIRLHGAGREAGKVCAKACLFRAHNGASMGDTAVSAVGTG